MDLIKLALPFNDSQIRYRVGATNAKKVRRETGDPNARPTSGLALAYVDARDAYDRFDEVCRPENWADEFYDVGSGLLACRIGIRTEKDWVWKSHGAGGRSADRGLSSQDANKGNFSDAFKTTAVAWGVARYLYGMKSQWVSLDKYGQIQSNMRPLLDKAHQMLCAGKMPEPLSLSSEPTPDTPKETPRRSKINSRDDYSSAQKAIDDASDMVALIEVWKKHWPIIQTMHVDYEDEITLRKDDKKHELSKKAA